MNRSAASPVRTVRLTFGSPPPGADAPVRSDLSCATVRGNHLWVATDEGTRVERLTRTADGSYDEHEPVDLVRMLRLPMGKKQEIDIEGMHVEEDRLWLVGSHAHTRDKPDLAKNAPAEAIAQLGQVDENPNRWILARIPLACLLPSEDEAAAKTQADPPARLSVSKKGSALLDLLAGDPHLAPFMALPAKENGFDIEGIAARGQQVFLGLRGPVLRGWAVILELCLEPRAGKLKLKRLGAKGPRYRKHFLDLEGCGVRDLCWQGEDLLILAGPTMVLDGAVRLHRWRPPAGSADSITKASDCPAIMDLPSRRGSDRAEGIALLEGSAEPELLVVYDGPHPDRLHGGGSVDADVFVLTG
ncbi:MAG TPA: DUF3616 domain-containing protein [Geminicoccus sp.]|uniref:DUF3616 domain-containing protein n=1 Tax=Geminicoccus sp. TaxID=2024832 RepID=UPI002E2F6840|nr:DUF3616 domain-containing protein [Geminicoccus sp.]HEX2526867.1 DUF3616 domain-containing protein [Geminicoccus sp.]